MIFSVRVELGSRIEEVPRADAEPRPWRAQPRPSQKRSWHNRRARSGSRRGVLWRGLRVQACRERRVKDTDRWDHAIILR